MAAVLVATLGESPVVVTAMYEALQKHPSGPRLKPEKVYLLYPGEETGRFIGIGAELIQEQLKNQCDVIPCPLPFEDARSYEDSILFLRTLHHVLEECRHEEVYVSLAGGRKSMSALAGIIAQFHRCIRGVYHLLDKYEDDPVRHSFYTIEELDSLPASERKKKMFPPVENLNIITIPFQYLANSSQLIEYFQGFKCGEIAGITTDGSADAFFPAIFGPKRETGQLECWISEEAKKEFEALDASVQQQFFSYIQTLSRLEFIARYRREAYQGFKTDCECYPEQRAHSNLRLFYSWEKKGARLNIHRVLHPHDRYERLLKRGRLWKADYPPKVQIQNLKAKAGTLVITLGRSPMIVTQTYVLLKSQVQIERVAVVYPEKNGQIQNGVRLLKDMFTNRRLFDLRGGEIDFQEYPLSISDVDSEETCRVFAVGLEEAIYSERNSFPHFPLYLSLSGGRKGMAVLVYLAAQRAGLREVYHTVITDPELEKKIEKETGLKEMNRPGLTLNQKAEYMFLHNYQKNIGSVKLFSIPVLPII